MSTIPEPGILPAKIARYATTLLVDGPLKLFWVKAGEVEKVWGIIEPWVLKTLRYDGVLTLDQIQTSLMDNDSQLFVVLENDLLLHSFGIFELLRDGFGNKFCRITSLAGHDLLKQQLFLRCVEEWARGNGCKWLSASVTESGARLFKRFGFSVRNVEITKEL